MHGHVGKDQKIWAKHLYGISSHKWVCSPAGNKENEALIGMARLTRDGFVKSMKENNLDALVTPGLGASVFSVTSIPAIGGFPGISVPAGYDSKGVPIGICFWGLKAKGLEPKLIEITYSFEKATKIRKRPSFKP